MSTTSTTQQPLARNLVDAERRWFYGGGIHQTIAGAADTGSAFLLTRVVMVQDKITPLHTHPVSESLYVLEGELLVHLDGEQFSLHAGGFTLAPAGVPHAFKVVSPTATILDFQEPGTCEAFYLGASTPLADGEDTGPVDFEKIMESGRANGGFTPLGPPPF